MQGVYNGTQTVDGSLSSVLSQMRQSSMKANESRTSSMQKGKTKKLNYNSKEISAQLLRAGKSQSVSSVLVRAKSKLNMLKNCQASGNYERQEVENAIIHANKIVRCAEMKLGNLREEERLKEQNEKIREAKQQMQRQEELEERRKKNRVDEYGEVQKAELEYLKQSMLDVQKTEGSYEQAPLVAETGVVLELSTPAADVSSAVE